MPDGKRCCQCHLREQNSLFKRVSAITSRCLTTQICKHCELMNRSLKWSHHRCHTRSQCPMQCPVDTGKLLWGSVYKTQLNQIWAGNVTLIHPFNCSYFFQPRLNHIWTMSEPYFNHCFQIWSHLCWGLQNNQHAGSWGKKFMVFHELICTFRRPTLSSLEIWTPQETFKPTSSMPLQVLIAPWAILQKKEYGKIKTL